ncbi:MAG: hypothetical protein HQ568_09290, partial [Calditrichaeota bacterium]|nr:hypothetical protein [Calditrichota bacterium]
MSKLHTGLLHRDLEPALTTEIQSLKSADSLESVMILVGSRLLGDYLGWRCAEKGFNLFNVRFVSFAELADDLSLEDRLVDSRPLMPPHGEFLYLLDAVSNLKTPHYFDKVSGRFSFIRTLKASFNNLDEALIDKLDALVIKPQDHSDKLTVLAGLRRSYQDNINRFRRPLDNFIPPDNPKKSFSDAYNTGHLIIYGFYDFNAAQRALLKSLAEEIELSVYLPWCEGDVTGSAFQFAQPTVRFFEKLISDAPPTLAGGDNVVLYSPPAITSITCHPIVNSYGHRLFNFGAAKNEDPETSSKHNLVVFNASDQAAEVRSIVGRINEAALWDEIPLSRIGIILWQPDSYLPLLKHELERAGLPFYDAIGETLAQTSECRAFLSLLNMCGRTIERKALVDLIASYELKLRVTNKNPEVSGQVVYSTNKTEPDPVAWETISIQTGIVDGDLQCWLSALDYLSSSSEVNQDRVGADLSSPTESGLSKLAPTRYSSFISYEQITLFREFIEA